MGELGDGKTDGVDEASLMKLLEGDFDPEKFEELMKETYNDDFYQKEDVQWKTDRDVRSSLKEDEDGDLVIGQDGEDGDLYDDEGNEDLAGEDAGDENFDEEEEWPEEEEYFEEEQPTESAIEQKVKDKMMDELYKLDYEDIVAGMPTRFKYRKVEPNSFGLSTEEILFARDSSLKQFVSLKRMAPYREDGEYFVGSKKRRRFRDMLTRDLEETVGNQEEVGQAQEEEQMEETKGENKRRRRRKRGKKKSEGSASGATSGPSKEVALPVKREDEMREASEPKSKRRRSKKDPSENTAPETTSTAIPDDDLTQKGKAIVETENPTEVLISVEPETKKKKKKRKKDKSNKKKKEKKMKSIDGVSESRLASYGL